MRLKRWRVMYVTDLYDDGYELGRFWTERGAWRALDRHSWPSLHAEHRRGWPEVRRTSETRTTGQVLDDELQRMLQEQVPSWPDHPQCEHDPIVRRGDD